MFLYVIASSADTVKIGYSSDPERRLRQLQTGHERRLSLVYKEAVETDCAPILEKLIHQANRPVRMSGEWFKLTHDQAIAELKFAIIRYSDELGL